MAAANHRERGGAVKITGPRQGGHRNFAGVDRVIKRTAGCRFRADAQHAIFGVQNNAMFRGNQVSDQRGNAHPQVDHIAAAQLRQGSLRHHQARPIHLFAAARHRRRGA